MSDSVNTPPNTSPSGASPQPSALASKIDGVRGHSAFDQPVSMGDRLACGFFDLALATCLGVCILGLTGASPVPSLIWLAYALPAYFLFWLLPRILTSRTAGEILWGLKPHDLSMQSPSFSERMGLPPLIHPLMRARNSGGRRALGTVVTLAAWAATAWIASETVLEHPVLAVAAPQRLQAFVPPIGDAPEARDWTVVPFYYTLGAWPLTYHRLPIFYSIPYEKGPPERFIGRLQAHWDLPDTRLILEGPKTPLVETEAGKPAAPIARDVLRACFEKSLAHDPGTCLRVREEALARHVEEIRSKTKSKWIDHWEARWFSVENAAMPAAESAQGVHLTAISGESRQDRYILVSAKGTHQMVRLDSPRGPEGDEARALLAKSISSLRVSDDLSMGRAWIDRELSQIRLLPELRQATRTGATADERASTTATGNAELLDRLARIQALLIAKASVDPKTYDTYFHLGGSAILLMRLAVGSRTSQKTGSGENLSGSARALIQSAHAFAMDLAPEDPRTTQLQDMVTEAASY